MISAADVFDAWRMVARPVCIVEKWQEFDFEMSVIVARTVDGQCRAFRPVRNDHQNRILDVTTAPADISESMRRAAVDLAIAITESLGVVGLLAVEMFVIGEKILVNELAPRPHNSGHFSFDACVTSQFEQQLRAVCGLPLGDVSLLSPVAMANLLGDLWSDGEPDWSKALATDPRVKLHLYGKQKPLPGRKMGHLTVIASSAPEARRIALAARDALDC